MARLDVALTERLTHILAERRVPGGGFIVFGPGREPTIAVAGQRRSRQPGAVQAGDHWHVGSITKSMTATVLLQLHDRGVLDLDESVMSGLAGTKWERRADARHFGCVTIRDLLAHRSGIRANPTYALFSRYVLFRERLERTNKAALRQSLTYGIGPAREYLYSNSGYGVAGLIAAHRTGRSWQQLVQEHIADAAGIESLGFGRPEWHGEHPWGHRRSWLRPGYTEYRITKRGLDLEIMRPAGDVFLSLEGLAQYGTAHLEQLAHLRQLPYEDGDGGGPLMSARAAEQMYTPAGTVMDAQRGSRYGLGWNIDDAAPDFGGERLLWHNGSDLFSFAMIGLLPERGLGFAWVTNALQKKWRTNPWLVWEPVSKLVADAAPTTN